MPKLTLTHGFTLREQTDVMREVSLQQYTHEDGLPYYILSVRTCRPDMPDYVTDMRLSQEALDLLREALDRQSFRLEDHEVKPDPDKEGNSLIRVYTVHRTQPVEDQP